jgi:hypothetical protein
MHEAPSSRGSKPYFSPASGERGDGFTTGENYGYAVKIDGIENNFPSMPWGRQGDALKAVQQFKATAKKDWISTKRRDGRRPLAEVKKWVNSVQPDQFYARWPTKVDDDSLEIWYTGGNIGVGEMREAPRTTDNPRGLEIGDAVQFRFEPETGGTIKRFERNEVYGEPKGVAVIDTPRGERKVPTHALRLRRSASRMGEEQGFEVVSADGRVIGTITAPNMKTAHTTLAGNIRNGWYPKDAKLKGYVGPRFGEAPRRRSPARRRR